MQFIPFLVAILAVLLLSKQLVRPLIGSTLTKGYIVLPCILYNVEPTIYATIGICSYFLANHYLGNL